MNNRTNIHYKYTSKDISFGSGTVKAELSGRNKELENGRLRIHGSPYDLFIFIYPKDRQFSKLILSNVSLLDNEANAIIFENNKSLEKSIEDIGVDAIVFNFNNIANDKYNPLTLKIRFKYIINGVNKMEELTFQFEKNYKEFKSSTVWDTISSA